MQEEDAVRDRVTKMDRGENLRVDDKLVARVSE